MKFSTHTFEDEIFAKGKWAGFDATEKVLRDIVANFSLLSSVLKVPLKLGHNEAQKMTDGQPALGWISSVRLDDESKPTKVLATYTDMPTIVFNAIKSKLYRTRSIELEDIKKGGEVFSNVLTAVALLGSDLPRVTTLRDLDKYLMSKDIDFNSYKIDQHRDTSITVSDRVCFSINLKEDLGMTPEEIKKLQHDLAAANLKAANLESANVTLTTANTQFSADNTAREENAVKEEVKTKRKSITSLFETAVKDEVITPAQRETFSKLLGVDDDTKVISIELEQVKELIGDKKTTMFSQNQTAADAGDYDEGSSPSEVLSQKTFSHMEKTGSDDFEKSLNIVMQANKKLADDYKMSNGVYE